MTEEYTLVVPGPKICSKCGSWNRLEVHHINGNHGDNRPENLRWLCHECHVRVHHRYIPEPDFGSSLRKETDFSFRFKR